jgi:hypothetical protein
MRGEAIENNLLIEGGVWCLLNGVTSKLHKAESNIALIKRNDDYATYTDLLYNHVGRILKGTKKNCFRIDIFAKKCGNGD